MAKRSIPLPWAATLAFAVAAAIVAACGGGEDQACDPTTDPSCACDPSVDPTCVGDGGTDGTIDGTSDGKPDGASDGKIDGSTDGTGDGVVVDSPLGDSSCQPSGGACLSATDCCSLDCVVPTGATTGTCSGSVCLPDGTACSAGGTPCCSTICGSDGTCTPLCSVDGGTCTCKTTGNPCTADGDCCSKYCNPTNGKCDNGGSFCIETGDVCTTSGDCCSGFCIMVSPTIGTCGPPPGGPSFCGGGKEAGEHCTDCTDCCSRVCAPYGTTGVSICQRAEGCHIDGDLCRKDSDCCGATGSGVPGDGHVTCDFGGSPPGSLVGICRNPLGCDPEGDVCHYKFPAGTTCGVSSARNDCCDHLGSKSNCDLDPLGVPRCHASDGCFPCGAACADSLDCCGGNPCVPDGSGALKCSCDTCIPISGPCTTDADCCPGGTCHIAVGSTSGTCTPPITPPPTDAGTDSSPPDVFTDSPPPDSGTDGPPPDTCSLYGQRCTTSADCCAATPAVPCTDVTTGLPCAGGTSCYCVFPLH